MPDGRYVCEYCGSTFERPNIDIPMQPLIIERRNEHIRSLETRVSIQWDDLALMGSECMGEFTLRRMRDQLADALVGMLEIESQPDMEARQYIVSGRIRVLTPEYRF